MDVVLIGRVLGGMLAATLGGLCPVAVRAAVDDPMRPPADVLQARQTGAAAAAVPQVSQVQAIKRQNGVVTALVTGRWVRVGDALEGGRITHITERGVTLAKGNEQLLLLLGPASVRSSGDGVFSDHEPK